MKPIRLLPVVMVSAVALLSVKGTGIVLTGGYALDRRLDRRGADHALRRRRPKTLRKIQQGRSRGR